MSGYVELLRIGAEVEGVPVGPSAGGAALALGLAQRLSASVYMPFDDRLLALAHWQRQLWAESLGKDGQGATPVVARGAVDQHSQLQLYLDGPADKLFALMTVGTPSDGLRIAGKLAAMAGADYLAGKSLDDLMAAEASATRDALGEAGRPLRESFCRSSTKPLSAP